MMGALLAWLRGRSDTISESREFATPDLQPRSSTVPEPSQERLVDANGLPLLNLDRYVGGDEVLGRGGMGTVRLVRDTVLCRDVAVKLLDPLLAANQNYLQGFVDEARIAAQLEHPNIAPVHDLGSDSSGTIYFTMKRVAGATLHTMLLDPSIPPGSSERLAIGLEIMLKVCDALEFAHSRGVLHRDIKPANIMVGGYGEVYLMDWGLAKVLDGRQSVVDVPRDRAGPFARMREGAVGTPSFMSPEMARGESNHADETSDVFCLGAVLYAIVTGQVPFNGQSNSEVLLAASLCRFTPPDEIPDLFVPKKLTNIVMTAMAAKPADRFPTVGALAEALRGFIHRGLHLPRERFKAGEKIVVEGTVGDSAYIVTAGRCVVYRMVGGERRVLREMGLGSLFGEAAVLGAVPRSATVEALTNVTVLVISQETIVEGLGGAGSWESLMVKTLVERFRELDSKDL